MILDPVSHSYTIKKNWNFEILKSFQLKTCLYYLISGIVMTSQNCCLNITSSNV